MRSQVLGSDSPSNFSMLISLKVAGHWMVRNLLEKAEKPVIAWVVVVGAWLVATIVAVGAVVDGCTILLVVAVTVGYFNDAK